VFQVGPLEIALVAIIALIVLGPAKLPDAARAMGGPIRYDGEFFAARCAAPGKAQHTREVLAEIGYTEAEIQTMCSEGVVR
jgi:formyl-CoA transferase